MKAAVSTGYSSDPAVLDFVHYGFSGKLTKPYKINDLKNVLVELIKK